METTIGGYRILRKIAEGTRSDVYLAAPQRLPIAAEGATATQASGLAFTDPADDVIGDAAAGAPGQGATAVLPPSDTVALKLIRQGVASESVDREIAALDAVQSPHIVRLRDLFSTDNGQVGLVLDRLPPAGLAQLLTARRELEPGEAVTVLAPIAAALRDLHGAGFSHGSLATTAVLFDQDGRPVIVGLGHAAPAPAGLSADRQRFSQLASAVLAKVPDRDDVARATLDEALDELGRGGGSLHTVIAALFSWADPCPIAVGSAGEASLERRAEASSRGREIPARVWNHEASSRDGEDAQPRASHRAAARPRRRTHVKRRGGRLSGRSVDSVVALLGALRDRPASVRPGVRWLAVAGAFALAAAVGLWISEPTRAESPLPTPSIGSAAGASFSASSGTSPDGAVPLPTSAQSAAIMGDDPENAARALIELRELCLTAASIECLAAVDQPGSSILAADVSTVGGVSSGDPAPALIAPSTEIDLVQRLGDSAILESGSTSLLLIRADEGWRLRDLFVVD